MPPVVELVQAIGLGKTYRGAKGDARWRRRTSASAATRARSAALGPNGAGKITTLRMPPRAHPHHRHGAHRGPRRGQRAHRVRASIGFLREHGPVSAHAAGALLRLYSMPEARSRPAPPVVRPAGHGVLPRPPLRHAVHRHEAEGERGHRAARPAGAGADSPPPLDVLASRTIIDFARSCRQGKCVVFRHIMARSRGSATIGDHPGAHAVRGARWPSSSRAPARTSRGAFLPRAGASRVNFRRVLVIARRFATSCATGARCSSCCCCRS